jgi:hypothetical protein
MSKKVSLICLTIIMALIAGPKIIGPKLATAAGSFQDSSGCADYDPNLEKFVISPRIPRDAYNSGNNNCPKVKPPKPGPDSIKLQRVYDIFSWKSFLAINWPVDPQCQAVDESEYEKKCTKKEITDTSGVPRWATWKESYEVFMGPKWQYGVLRTSNGPRGIW